MNSRSSDPVSSLHKGLGTIREPLATANVAAKGWNLLREDLSLPAAVIYVDRVAHNLDWMRRFVEGYGVKLCPHGKTTMAPALFRRQIEAGAWGITLANAVQTRVAHAHGIRRVFMANQLVGRQALETISELLKDLEFDFYCLVDSPEHVRLLGQFFASRGQRLKVLIEVGASGARAGVRCVGDIEPIVAEQRLHADTIDIVGVELFEGIFKDEPSVRSFLQTAIECGQRLVSLGLPSESPLMVSGAGSAWFDVVAEMFSAADFGRDADLILRPGCYITHDCGSYVEPQKRMSASNSVVQSLGEGLLPSLQVWAYVLSCPEPGVVIAGLGKRDASYDNGLPVPSHIYRPGGAYPSLAPANWEVTKIMDQHAILAVGSGDDLHIGDIIGFDISHPCLTFDKWKYLALLDSDYNVTGIVETFF